MPTSAQKRSNPYWLSLIQGLWSGMVNLAGWFKGFRNIRNLLLALIIVDLLSPLSHENDSFATYTYGSRVPAKERILMIVNGGWACELFFDGSIPRPKEVGVFRNYRKLALDLARNHNIASSYIFSCFGHGPKDKLFYYLSDEPAQKKHVKITRYLKRVTGDIRAKNYKQIYILGHSHGGWLAIKTASYILKHTKRKIAGLITLDPVSPIKCHISQSFEHLGAYLTDEKYENNSTCTKISDIPQKELREIAAHTSHWDHYFQRKLKIIHSGPIELATENTELFFPWHTLNEHSEVDTHLLPWQNLKRRIVFQNQYALKNR